MKNYIRQRGIKYDNLHYILADGRQIEILELTPSKTKSKGQWIEAIHVKLENKCGLCRLDDKSNLKNIIIAESARREKEFEKKYIGIDVLLSAKNSTENYFEKFNKMMEDENNDGVNPPKESPLPYDKAKEKYPAAYAYTVILAYADADPSSQVGYNRSRAGESAITEIENGMDVIHAKNMMVETVNNVVLVDY